MLTDPAPTPVGMESRGSAQPIDTKSKQRWDGSHPIDIRLSVPLLFGRVYITLLAGGERRSAARRRADSRLKPLFKIGNFLVFVFLGALVGFALTTALQLLAYWIWF